ncbi:MAG: PrgI family protein [Proteobacteria bacterium]|nr:PrgI family protein [Pseudomonadota bacterium]
MAQAPAFIGALFIVVVGLWRSLGSDGALTAWSWIFITLGVPLVVFGALNILKPATLTLEPGGFTWSSWRYRAFYPWSHIERFLVAPSKGVGDRPRVAFNFLPGQVPNKVQATALNRTINGYDRSMRNDWDISTEELVVLLNDTVEKARAREAG